MATLFWPTMSMLIVKGGEYGNDRGPRHSPRFHQGCDIGIGVGTPIYASGNGTVELVANTGTSASYGLYVRVRYGDITVINSHMSRVDVEIGDPVSVGTKLGLSGGIKGAFGAGDATGPHDHLEIRVGGVLADPSDYLNPRSQLASGGATPADPTSDTPHAPAEDFDMPKPIYFVATSNNPSVTVGAGDIWVRSAPGEPLRRMTQGQAVDAWTLEGLDLTSPSVKQQPGYWFDAAFAEDKVVAGYNAQVHGTTVAAGADTTAILAAIAALGKQDSAQQALALAAITAIPEATLAAFGLKRA